MTPLQIAHDLDGRHPQRLYPVRGQERIPLLVANRSVTTPMRFPVHLDAESRIVAVEVE